jgi:hypothetical protein
LIAIISLGLTVFIVGAVFGYKSKKKKGGGLDYICVSNGGKCDIICESNKDGVCIYAQQILAADTQELEILGRGNSETNQ